MEGAGEGLRLRGYRVHGRVQGVGFRWWTRTVAEELGVGGSVRSLPDGSVEVRAAGPIEAIAAFERKLREGPPFARVDEVEPIDPGPIDATKRFRIDT